MRRATALLFHRGPAAALICGLAATRHTAQLSAFSAPTVSPLVCARRVASDKTAAPSAVNVEEFTLNEEIVKRDLENMARWNELSEAIDAAREANDQKQVLTEITKGLAMLEELGVQSAPIQCETLLCMEGSQAHYNSANYGEALKLAQRARNSLTSDGTPALQDKAQIAEIDQFIGFILCKDGKGKEAQDTFEKVLHWIDVDARAAMPMQAVAAVNLRRSVLTGLGQSRALQAQQQEAAGNSGDAKELYSTALDTLIEALDKHIDENDYGLVKSTLETILQCFEGVKDVEQAVTTCRKYISWCSRHEDEAGIEQGKKMLDALCQRHNIVNPMLDDDEGKAKK